MSGYIKYNSVEEYIGSVSLCPSKIFDLTKDEWELINSSLKLNNVFKEMEGYTYRIRTQSIIGCLDIHFSGTAEQVIISIPTDFEKKESFFNRCYLLCSDKTRILKAYIYDKDNGLYICTMGMFPNENKNQIAGKLKVEHYNKELDYISKEAIDEKDGKVIRITTPLDYEKYILGNSPDSIIYLYTNKSCAEIFANLSKDPLGYITNIIPPKIRSDGPVRAIVFPKKSSF